MAHHDHVAIELQHLHSILDGLLIEVTGTSHLGIGESRDMTAEAVHGGFVSQTSARRRLIKGSHQGLLFEHVHILACPRDGFHLRGNIKDVEKLIPLELLERENITTSETTHTNLLFNCGFVRRQQILRVLLKVSFFGVSNSAGKGFGDTKVFSLFVLPLVE